VADNQTDFDCSLHDWISKLGKSVFEVGQPRSQKITVQPTNNNITVKRLSDIYLREVMPHTENANRAMMSSLQNFDKLSFFAHARSYKSDQTATVHEI